MDDKVFGKIEGMEFQESEGLAEKHDKTRSGQRANIESINRRLEKNENLAQELSSYEKRHNVGTRTEYVLQPGERPSMEARQSYKEDYLRRKKNGRTTPDEDLMFKISAATEDDNLTGRIRVARAEARASQLEDDMRRGEMTGGQSEEEVMQERQDSQAKYLKFRKSAWRQALKELEQGII